jgi:hypothetical protein
MMRIADLISITLCLAIVAASYSLWGSRGEGVFVARLQMGTASPELVALDGHRVMTYTGPLGVTKVEIDQARARFVESPCHDQRCVLSGWVSRPGAAIVCLPNRVSLDLAGTPSGYDAISF